MEMYNAYDLGTSETYKIQGSQSAPLSTSTLIEQIETMYHEGAPEFIVDHGMYYPTTTNYGYYCTGFESAGDRDEQHRVFTVEGPEVQHQGAETENSPYVYYTPGYGYAQSPYNPYNPYIPGAVFGLDGSFIGPQQFLTNSQYQNYAYSPYYALTDGQSMPEALPNNPSDSLPTNTTSLRSRPNGYLAKHSLSTRSTPSSTIASESPLNHLQHFTKVDVAGANGLPKQPSTHEKSNYESAESADNVANKMSHSCHNQPKAAVSSGSTETGLAAEERSTKDKNIPKSNQERTYGVNGSIYSSDERNLKCANLKSKLVVRAYTSKIKSADADGNITIHTDHFNKEDFPIDYVKAKFFVIKSYSEDDVHKSIKYNIWSSTPNGNKKLNYAFEDAQRSSGGIPGDCPVFLFFSVNASGQFCGVAEMVDKVDFHRDMDFWQQDKWSGSFPVKWHIVKDVPNSYFRHITLENNENKPVTNSRDTQEIAFMPGRDMLKMFKNHKLKTSLLDDFMYYENRQKVTQEGRERFRLKNYGTALFVPALELPKKITGVVEFPITENEKPNAVSSSPQSIPEKDSKSVLSSLSEDTLMTSSTENSRQDGIELKDDGITSSLKIESMTINSKVVEAKAHDPPSDPDSDPENILTIGSVAVKISGLSGSSGPLTFRSLPPNIDKSK